jgi:DNA-binding NtrC family response regulator
MLFSALWPGNFRQLENTIAKLIELADIHTLSMIDKDCTHEAMNDMLGKVEATPTDVLRKALFSVSRTLKNDPDSGLAETISCLAEAARNNALEMSGGDIEEAAKLINESPKKLEIFAASREARQWIQK